MASFYPASLASFIIFTPKNTREGDEHEKLLFHYPQQDLDKMVKLVGLSEALVNFTGKFSPEKPCESVHYEKSRSLFLLPEPNAEQKVYMVMNVNNPYTMKSNDKKQRRYKENDLDDLSLQTVLRHTYKMFKLFHGTYEGLMKQSEEDLKNKLMSFFPTYLKTINFSQIDLFTTLEGIHFLPVHKNVYLRIQCFINLAENSFPSIKYSGFLYRDHLVWSGMEQDDMRILYECVGGFLTPCLTDQNQPPFPFPDINRIQEGHGFIIGPDRLKDPTKIDVPIVYIGSKSIKHYLIIYKFQHILCLFLVDAESPPDLYFFRQLHSFIPRQVDILPPILEENFMMKKQNLEEQYRYIYFNNMNFAIKTSVKERATITRETMKMLNDIHNDFERYSENLNEILIRTEGDKWVVGRKSDQREFYVIFDQKTSHLLEINEQVKRLSATYFNSIFID